MLHTAALTRSFHGLAAIPLTVCNSRNLLIIGKVLSRLWSTSLQRGVGSIELTHSAYAANVLAAVHTML